MSTGLQSLKNHVRRHTQLKWGLSFLMYFIVFCVLNGTIRVMMGNSFFPSPIIYLGRIVIALYFTMRFPISLRKVIQMLNPAKEHDMVETTTFWEGCPEGTIGTIVHVYPDDAFGIEVHPVGQEIKVITLERTQFKKRK